MEPDKMQAGASLDRLIAEKVMGWKPIEPYGKYLINADNDTRFVINDECRSLPSPPMGDEFYPSTDIAHAWEVIERLRADGWIIWIGPCADNGPDWDVQIKRGTNYHERVTAETAPLVICRAALKTV